MDNPTIKIIALALLVSLASCGGGSDNNDVAADNATTGGSGSSGSTNPGDANNTPTGGAGGAVDTPPANGGSGGGTGGGTGGNTGGSPDNGGGSVGSNVKFYGIVTVRDRQAGDVDISGGFGRFSVDVPVQLALDQLTQTDSCTVSKSDIGGVPGDFEIPDFSNSGAVFNLVSAGDVIPFTSPSGPYGDLMKMVNFGFTVYTVANNLPGPAPSGLQFNIPGDVYPAFSNVSVPDAAPVAWIGPVGNGALTPNSVLTWQPSGDPNAAITLFSLFFSLTNPLAGTTSLSCTLKDDGTHTFSQATKDAMGSDFAGSAPPQLSRIVTTVRQGNGAVLAVSHENDAQPGN